MHQHTCREAASLTPYLYRTEIQQLLAEELALIGSSIEGSRTVIRVAARVLRMGLLQCSLIRWLLSWGTVLKPLEGLAQGVCLFKRNHERVLFLLVVLNGYHVKSFLSRGQNDPSFQDDLLEAVPTFGSIHSQWQPSGQLNKLTLAQLNTLFQSSFSQRGEGSRDYGMMVFSILGLSKTYNIGGKHQKSSLKKRPRKEKEDKSRQAPHSHSEKHSMTPIYEPVSEGEDAGQSLLRVSSGRYSRNRPREFPSIERYENRQILGSNHPSQPSIFESGQRSRIKPTSSFFDDI